MTAHEWDSHSHRIRPLPANPNVLFPDPDQCSSMIMSKSEASTPHELTIIDQDHEAQEGDSIVFSPLPPETSDEPVNSVQSLAECASRIVLPSSGHCSTDIWNTLEDMLDDTLGDDDNNLLASPAIHFVRSGPPSLIQLHDPSFDPSAFLAQEQHTVHSERTNPCTKKKPTSTHSASLNRGAWSAQEHQLFLEGLQKYGRSKWREIANHIGTRNRKQTASHFQSIVARHRAAKRRK